MSAPESSATIKFPAAMIDSDVRKALEECGVKFEGDIPKGVTEPFKELEVEIEEGIFHLHDSQARYGEFDDLERLLIEKKIPFDRRSFMDWDRPPVLRVFRPGDPPFDHTFELDSEGHETVINVEEVRERLGDPEALLQYLNENFPSYPPLADYVKE